MLADRVRIGRKKGIKYIGEVYLAQDDDFVKVNTRWVYRGSELEIEIPHIIQGEEVRAYEYMFYGSGNFLATPVTRVDSNNKNVTTMRYMFTHSSAATLDLSSFDTSNVNNMGEMFYGSQATTLDLSNFDTSNVSNMGYMFWNSNATSLDLSNFDTSNVTSMSNMFRDSNATSLDLSSFDTSNVSNMSNMFRDSQATTGYARTQADADRFNNSSNKPSTLNFIVKSDKNPILYDTGKYADKWNPVVESGTVDMIKKPSYLYSKNTVAGTNGAEWVSTEKIDFTGFHNLNVEFENDKSFERQIGTFELSNYQSPYYIRLYSRIGILTDFLEQFFIIISDTSTGDPVKNSVKTINVNTADRAQNDMITYKIHKIWLS